MIKFNSNLSTLPLIILDCTSSTKKDIQLVFRIKLFQTGPGRVLRTWDGNLLLTLCSGIAQETMWSQGLDRDLP